MAWSTLIMKEEEVLGAIEGAGATSTGAAKAGTATVTAAKAGATKHTTTRRGR